MKKHLVVIVFLLMSLISGFIHAESKYLNAHSYADFLMLVGDEQQQNIGDKVYFYEDKLEQATLADISNLSADEWTKSEVNIPNFGYTDASYWFRITLKSSDKQLDKLLAVQYSLLDYIEVHVLAQGEQISSYTTGDTFAFSQRPIRHRDFLFPLLIQPDQTIDVFIKVKTQGSLQVPMVIWDRAKFVWQDQDEQFIKAIYYGILLVLVIYNLFLFVSIRERSYLYYSALVVSVLVLMSGAHGFLYQYLYPEYPSAHRLSMLLAVPSVMLFAGLFASQFLRLAAVAPHLNKLVQFFNAIFIGSVIGAFFLPYDISTRISVFLAIPSSLVFLFAGPYAWYKGQSSARYFTYAWAFLITGIVVSASSKFGLLPRNDFTEHALSWGSVLEAILLSFALADRFNRERQDKIKAQQAQLEEEAHRKAVEAKLYNQATHQTLDGFPNSVLFNQIVYSMLYENESKAPNFSLFYVQLSRIQDISKTLGHANADIVLGLFSKRLLRIDNHPKNAVLIESATSHNFYFAHIEKGLFGFLVKDIELNSSVEYANELMKIISEPIDYKGMKLDLGVLIGLAICPLHGSDIDALTRHARVAIECADNGNGHVGVYSADINPYSQRRLVLMGELKKAIDNDSLALHYQPIISCATGEVTGTEALVRWNHEKLGFVPPDEFISIAEQTGVMRYLTRWVIKRALKDHAERRREFGASTISINISAINLHEPDFEERILGALERFGIPPEELILEITETSVMKDPDYAIAAMNRLSKQKIKLAIDDFGTGYSSLTYIQKMPIYEIKIDRSFVQKMDKNKSDKVIVKATMTMAKELGYRVVAEGIETQSVLMCLKNMQCEYAQGYYIAKPTAIDQLISWQRSLKNADFFTELKSL